MSFGYAVGDVIAVLGLFERVAIELRNYKNAPVQFQQLSAELDLLRSTLQHVLQLHPETPEEHRTLEKIRAIAIHCLQPLQALGAKMQVKQSSLGQFRTTGTLRAVGTRLHWSMVAQKDVDELRKTVLSEMVAINMLLSVQQLGHTKQLSAGVRDCQGRVSMKSDTSTDALMKQTSTILSLVAGTPDAIANLHSLMIAQAEEQARQTKYFSGGMELIRSRIEILSEYTNGIRRTARRVSRLLLNIQKLLLCLLTCTKDMLEVIGRNTRMLLDIANQMRRIVRAIEAIPLHLTVDIIRLDDALGESWGLPVQACSSWESFRHLLEVVVFANGRAGAHQVINDQFVITLSTTGRRIYSWEWEKTITAGAHIEQAMIVDHICSSMGERCLRAGCDGSIIKAAGKNSKKSCSKCSQIAISQKKAELILDFFSAEYCVQDLPSRPQAIGDQPKLAGSEQFAKIHVTDEVHSFHRVCIIEALENIQDVSQAWKRLAADETDAAANRRVGLHLLQNTENRIPFGPKGDPIPYLRAATQLGDRSDAEAWYLLGRAYLNNGNFLEAHKALQQAVFWTARSPCSWNTVGILYFRVGQWMDSQEALSCSSMYNPSLWQTWFNLGVLHDNREDGRQYKDAYTSFKRCLELKPDLPNVAARLKVLKDYKFVNVPDDYKIDQMCDHELRIIEQIHQDGKP